MQKVPYQTHMKSCEGTGSEVENEDTSRWMNNNTRKK